MLTWFACKFFGHIWTDKYNKQNERVSQVCLRCDDWKWLGKGMA